MNQKPINPKTIPESTVDDIMTFWSSGKTLDEVAKHFDRSYRTVEQLVSRHRHKYERNFNFPHIIHAKRFGA